MSHRWHLAVWCRQTAFTDHTAATAACAVQHRCCCVQVITTSDREFKGVFTCLDHWGNILLLEAVEQVTIRDDSFERPLLQVVVPPQLLKSASVLVRRRSPCSQQARAQH